MNKFKVGDRVRMISHESYVQMNDTGIIKAILADEVYGVEWDIFDKGYNDPHLYEGKRGHCWNVREFNLELVPTEDKQVREVQRKAEVGEYIKIVESGSHFPRLNIGDIHKVVFSYCDGSVETDKQNEFSSEETSEYVVLENYTPQERTYTQAEVDKLIKQTKADILAKMQEALKEDKQ